MKRMLFLIVSIVCVSVLAAATANAGSNDLQKSQDESIALSSKVPISFYGFISSETMVSDSQLSSFGTLNNTPASYNRSMAGFNRVVDERVDGNNDAFISFTPQNTRLGFFLKPYDFGGKNFKVDGRIEMDFFSTTDLSAASMRPRIRRAYTGIGQIHWHLLFGQEWDLFSPLNPATLNIGGNLWQQGNLGFRRPQIRFTHKYDMNDKDSIETAISVNLPGNSTSFADNGNTNAIPMLEGRFGFMHNLPAGKLKLYLSALYARHNNAVAGKSDINNWGVAFSFSAPIEKYFIPSGEFQYGYSMGSLLSLASDTTRQRTISGWAQIKSKWLNWFETNFGYGIDTLKSSQVAINAVKRNQMAFFNIKFKPVNAFVIGLEYNYMRTNYQGNNSSKANTALMNVIFFF